MGQHVECCIGVLVEDPAVINKFRLVFANDWLCTTCQSQIIHNFNVRNTVLLLLHLTEYRYSGMKYNILLYCHYDVLLHCIS